MNTVSLSLTLSLMISSAVVGLAAGYYISPSYQATMYAKEDMGLGQADRFVDLRYLNKMAAHHTGAILLADQIIDKTQRPELKELAAEIIQNEPKLIDELYQWKKDWYKDAGKVSDPRVVNLGTADETIDLRFLNALIAHHEEGIEMTKEIRLKSARSDIIDNADAVERFLKASKSVLQQWREDWFAVSK